MHAYSINKVGLATARRSIQEEGVERGLTRMLGNGKGNGTRQLIGSALDKSVERLMGIQLGIDITWHRIHQGRRLIDNGLDDGLVNLSGLLGL